MALGVAPAVLVTPVTPVAFDALGAPDAPDALGWWGLPGGLSAAFRDRIRVWSGSTETVRLLPAGTSVTARLVWVSVV